MLSKREVMSLRNQGVDFNWIQNIQPQGGLSFKEQYIQAGDGVITCLYSTLFPTRPDCFWIYKLMNHLNTITKIDISSVEKEQVLKDFNSMLSEARYQASNERTKIDRDAAVDEYRMIEKYARQIKSGNEVPKLMQARIYTTGSTEEEVLRRKDDLSKTLMGSDFRVVTQLGYQKEEWEALLKPYSKQAITKPLQVNATEIGGGYPFNHQSLIDPNGSYVGFTDTNGAFVFDTFRITEERTSFSALVLGKSGAGKSTLLKVLADGLLGRNCYIRGFEINKDWTRWVKTNNGKLLDLSGRDGMLNPMQPLATTTDDDGETLLQLESYYQHRANFFTLIQFLNPDMRKVDMLEFNKLFDEFYITKGLLPRNYQDVEVKSTISIIGRPAKDYPTVREFHTFVKEYVSQPAYKNNQSTTDRMVMNDFLKVLENMAYANASIFNGHTTLEGLDTEKILFVDLQTINNFDEDIRACLMFQAISIIWQQAMKNGLKMKQLVREGKIKQEDVTYFLFFMDECQNILNPSYGFALDFIGKFVKEMRKFSAGVYFATQSPKELLPDHVDSHFADSVKKIFELCQYHIFLRLDNSVRGTIEKAMGTSFTDSEYELLMNLKRGESLWNLGGGVNYQVKIDPDQEQLEIFDGGH